MPPAAVATFGVMHDDNLCGAVVVTAGSRHAHRLLDGAKHDAVATLARLWLADALPRNSESRVLAIVVRHLRQAGEVRALVSYADPAAGHVGTIYQAAGWSYLGQSDVGRFLDLGDGTLHHPRSVYTLHGTNSPRVLRKKGIPARSVLVAGKHRYCHILDPAWAWRLRVPVIPYPTRPPMAESVP
ncbi:MAG: DNA methyltransferase [Acidimicrobiales bacterium]